MLLEFIQQYFVPKGEMEKAGDWIEQNEETGQLTIFPVALGK